MSRLVRRTFCRCSSAGLVVRVVIILNIVGKVFNSNLSFASDF